MNTKRPSARPDTHNHSPPSRCLFLTDVDQWFIMRQLGFAVPVRPTASFQAAHEFDAVGMWTNINNDQGEGEAVKKPTG